MSVAPPGPANHMGRSSDRREIAACGTETVPPSVRRSSNVAKIRGRSLVKAIDLFEMKKYSATLPAPKRWGKTVGQKATQVSALFEGRCYTARMKDPEIPRLFDRKVELRKVCEGRMMERHRHSIRVEGVPERSKSSRKQRGSDLN